ncbi:MAG: hypothetical protein JXA09_05900 [Anaerolineae bacterium]|nr:hypothetical protein [Anaerolineae bacterium]
MRIRTIAIGLLCALAALLAACQFTPEDRDLVRSFVEDWARSRNMHPIKEDGGISLEGLWNAGTRYVTGSTGDAEADAVLDAYEVISNLHEADVLMDKGRQERDAGPMDQAIGRRPGDWTYRVSRAALALEQGDLDAYRAQTDAAYSIVDQRGIDPVWYASQNIQDLQAVQDTLAAQGWPNREQCVQLNVALATYYKQRADLTGSEADSVASLAAAMTADACAE